MKFWSAALVAATVNVAGAVQASAGPGDLDAAFGSGGKVVVDFGGASARATALVIQPDGKVVIVGQTRATSDPASGDFAIVRLNADGTLDATFGTGGKVTTDFYGLEDAANAVVLQPDGKIVVAGFETGVSHYFPSSTGFALARYLPDGQLDSTFGAGGLVVTTAGPSTYPVISPWEQLVMATGLAVQPDGRIVAVGTAWEGYYVNDDVALARYNADGTLDSSFATCTNMPGVTTWGPLYNLYAQKGTSVVIVADGGIVVGGQALDGQAALRFGADGCLQSTHVMAETGIFGTISNALALQPDGRVVSAGFGGWYGKCGNNPNPSYGLFLARYSATGTVQFDASFGGTFVEGGQWSDFCWDTSFSLGANGVVVDPNGSRAVAVGSSKPLGGTSYDFRIVHYTALGGLDASIGSQGSITTDFFGADDMATGVVRRHNGRLVVAGSAVQSGVTRFVVAQYMGESDSVDLNDDGDGDVFLYSPVFGHWAFQNATTGGSFTGTGGSWSAGWSVTPASFNADGLTDVFLFNTATGQWFTMLNTGAGSFAAQTSGFWWPGWQRFVVDINGDGVSDVFLWDSASGTWFKCLSTGTGFSYEQGFWTPGFEVYPARLYADAFQDFFLFNRSTGHWFWVLGKSGPGFDYLHSGFWSTDWQILPADYTGDGLTDFLLYRPATGFWFVAAHNWFGFTYTSGFFTTGWTFHTLDLDADGRFDLFLHNEASGQWFEVLSNGAGGFTAGGSGFWSTGWDLHATDFNGDGRDDLLLYNPATGQWFQARNRTLGTFDYSSGIWGPGLTIVTGRPLP